MQTQIIIDKQLKEEYENLKKKMEFARSKFTIENFRILNRAYEIGKNLYGNNLFGYKQLAKDFKMGSTTVSRIMNLKKANKRTWKLIEQGKLGSHKVALILARRSRHFQNEVVDMVIKYNLSTKEITKIKTDDLDVLNDERRRIATERGFSQRQNAFRSIEAVLTRLPEVMRISPDFIPNTKIKTLKEMVEEAIELLEKYDKLLKIPKSLKPKRDKDGTFKSFK